MVHHPFPSQYLNVSSLHHLPYISYILSEWGNMIWNQAIFPCWYFHNVALTFFSKTNEYCREKCILHHFRTWHSNFSYQQLRLRRSFLSKLFKLIFFFTISILLVKFNQHCFVFSNDLPQSKVGEEKKVTWLKQIVERGTFIISWPVSTAVIKITLTEY